MTDDKRTTRHKILGELESIKTLLDDHAENGSREDDVPLLTEALNGVIHDIEESEASTDTDWYDLDQDDIPVLQAAVDEEEWRGPEHLLDTEESARIEEKRESPSSPSTLKAGPDAVSEQAEDSTHPDARLPEDQPSLFDQDQDSSAPAATPEQKDNQKLPPADPKLATPKPPPSSPADDPRVASVKGSPLAPPSKAENPFLPKHIRDRLHANRANQQEMLDSFLNSSHPSQQSPPAGSKPDPNLKSSQSTERGVDEQLVDEMLQLYLPRIESELREKLRALIKAERHAQEDNQEGS